MIDEQLPATWPAMSLAEAEAALTAPGAPFEMETVVIRGVPTRVWKNALPNLAAVNIVIHGLLGEGVASSTRFDPQAKAVGEWLRARVVPIPQELLA